MRCTNNRAYLIIQFIDGRDLEAIVKSVQTFLPLDLVVQWAIELCEALNYLRTHKPEPIIFGDLMPSHIMINRNNRVQLIDFGTAGVFPTEKAMPRANQGYAPPEQEKGKNLSPLMDIYALDATFHRVLIRRGPRLEPPFSFEECGIRTINPQVPPELESIVLRAVRDEPEERYPGAAAMKAGLASLQPSK